MKKILVVDDEEMIRALYALELQDAGYEVCTACNGEEALVMLDKVVPDLVTLDIRMPPGMDGLKVLKRIKEMRRDLPVILSTAYPAYKQDFSAWASDAYIVKSSDLNELINAVNNILAGRNNKYMKTGGKVWG